jgi:hypothetical protein
MNNIKSWCNYVIKQRENIDKLVVPKTLRLRLGDVVVPYGTRFRLRRGSLEYFVEFHWLFQKGGPHH